MSVARILVLLCALVTVAQAADTFGSWGGQPVPDDWLPPHFPKAAILQSITRSFDVGMGSGTFIVRPEDVAAFRSNGYGPATLKPDEDSRLYRMQQGGASIYAVRVGTASWIVALEDRPEKMLTIDGKKWIDGYFWVDRRLYADE
jgi:hypothetical protein